MQKGDKAGTGPFQWLASLPVKMFLHLYLPEPGQSSHTGIKLQGLQSLPWNLVLASFGGSGVAPNHTISLLNSTIGLWPQTTTGQGPAHRAEARTMTSISQQIQGCRCKERAKPLSLSSYLPKASHSSLARQSPQEAQVLQVQSMTP